MVLFRWPITFFYKGKQISVEKTETSEKHSAEMVASNEINNGIHDLNEEMKQLLTAVNEIKTDKSACKNHLTLNWIK